MSKKKTGVLTKVEKFYIDNNEDKNLNDIADDLNRSTAIIEKYLAETGKSRSEETETSSAGDLMARKEDRGVTVMTPAASQVADDTRSDSIDSGHHPAIYIIKKDK